MTQEELDEYRWQLLYRAEYSSRYHRRRAAFLNNLDSLMTLLIVVAGASAFGDLVAGTPGLLSKIAAATVTLIGLIQALLKLGAAGIAHVQWLKRWNRLHAAISLNTTPTSEQIATWTAEKTSIEEECVGELRALTLDCEDAAARVMKIPGRQHRIQPLQRLFIHFGTMQQAFPIVPDATPPVARRIIDTTD